MTTPQQRPARPGAPGADQPRLLSEARRSGIALGFGAVLTLGWVVARDGAEGWARVMDGIVVFCAPCLGLYVALTIATFARATPQQIHTWVRKQDRGTWVQRYVTGTAPGPGMCIFVSTLALVVAVGWLPRGGDLDSALPPGARLALGAVALVSSWVTVVVAFAVAYYADDLLADDPGLEFPGHGAPTWSDYIYFAISVSTTFGTTDVTVASPMLRRTVTVHAVLAFVFNTVILGAVVGLLV